VVEEATAGKSVTTRTRERPLNSAAFLISDSHTPVRFSVDQKMLYTSYGVIAMRR
jgi:hypothetical protein